MPASTGNAFHDLSVWAPCLLSSLLVLPVLVDALAIATNTEPNSNPLEQWGISRRAVNAFGVDVDEFEELDQRNAQSSFSGSGGGSSGGSSGFSGGSSASCPGADSHSTSNPYEHCQGSVGGSSGGGSSGGDSNAGSNGSSSDGSSSGGSSSRGSSSGGNMSGSSEAGSNSSSGGKGSPGSKDSGRGNGGDGGSDEGHGGSGSNNAGIKKGPAFLLAMAGLLAVIVQGY